MHAASSPFLILMAEPDDSQVDRQRPEGGKPTDRHGWQRGFANAWMVLGAAPSGLLLGYFIDRAYGTSPWWMLGLSLLFLAVSLYALIKDSLK
jgi:F0F1-type ATP synthase assembly protein I